MKIEQLHTTGGGWQDQIGGCIDGGFKIGSLAADKRCIWRTIPIEDSFRQEIERRLVLIYTGETRLAKNLLQVHSSEND